MITVIGGKRYIYFNDEMNGRQPNITVDGKNFVNNEGGSALYAKVDNKNFLFEDIYVDRYKYGINISGKNNVDIFDYQFYDINSDNQYGAAILRRTDHDGSVRGQRIFADGEEKPLNRVSGGYNTTNNEFFDIGGNKDVHYFRDITAKNFSDSIFDAKATVYIMNATLSNAYRIFRAWDDVKIVVVNSVIESGSGASLAWLTGSGRVEYYNTLWDGQRRPDLGEIDVQGKFGATELTAAGRQVVELSSNPLPGISNFFELENLRYSARVSVNGDKWIELVVPNGGDLRSFMGDPLFSMPDLGRGAYRVQTYEAAPGGAKQMIDDVSYTVTNSSFAYKGGVTKVALGHDGAVGGAVVTSTAVAAPVVEQEVALDASDVLVFLVDTTQNTKLATITDGARIAASTVASKVVGIVVEVRDQALEDDVGYAVLQLDGGAKRKEGLAPYALYGDLDGDYMAGKTMGRGDHTFTAAFYENPGDGGDLMATLRYGFEIY